MDSILPLPCLRPVGGSLDSVDSLTPSGGWGISVGLTFFDAIPDDKQRLLGKFLIALPLFFECGILRFDFGAAV
jgi:hypothetical protein